MKLISTRNDSQQVSFKQAIFNCMPTDGGLYVPYSEHDLRSWILHMNEQTSFSAIAGSLTAALLKEEISPVISERIAAKAFHSYSPRLRQLDDHFGTFTDNRRKARGCHCAKYRSRRQKYGCCFWE